MSQDPVRDQIRLNQHNQDMFYDCANENCRVDDIRRVGQQIFED